jgi:hypothetical protein
MSEHRKSERKRLMAFTPVYNSYKTILLGYLGDLSMEGAMLIGEKPMEINTQITLVIDFPETPEFTARQVRIPARVAWCRGEENAQYFNTGLEFQSIDPLYKPFIEAILERYQFQSDKPI